MARRRLAAVRLEHRRPVSLCLSLVRQQSDCDAKKLTRHGYSQHGDYVFGWKDDSLQRAMDARCTGDVCNVLKSQTAEQAMNCTLPRVVDEDIDSCKSHPSNSGEVLRARLG